MEGGDVKGAMQTQLLTPLLSPLLVLFLPISALYGHNIKDVVPKQRCSWYEGPALFDVSVGIAATVIHGASARQAGTDSLPTECTVYPMRGVAG
eukprot:1146622-Pelagomonas_calceolata.AAC.3